MFGDRNDCWAPQCTLRIKVCVTAEHVYPIIKVCPGCSEYLNERYSYLYTDNANNAESNMYYTCKNACSLKCMYYYHDTSHHNLGSYDFILLDSIILF